MQNKEQIGHLFAHLIRCRFDGRGKFKQLEEWSGITEQRWKNVFYGRTALPNEMLEIWVKRFPADAEILNNPEQFLTRTFNGELRSSCKPFNESGETTIGRRMQWVLAEWASTLGDDLLEYLELVVSRKDIPAEAWLKVVQGSEEPTLAMVQLVAQRRPQFACWLLVGYATSQIDPSKKALAEQ